MRLGILAQIFANEVEIIECSKTSCTIRTKEVVPFLGDFVCVELTTDDTFVKHAIADLSNADNDDMFETTIGNLVGNYTVNDQVLTMAAQRITKELSDYVLVLLNTQANKLGHEPIEQLYQNKAK